MDALMDAFDDAAKNNLGFGYHSVSVVALTGSIRLLSLLRRQLANTPDDVHDEIRKWAMNSAAIIDDVIEGMHASPSFCDVLETCIPPGSEDMSRIAMSFIGHLKNRGWIDEKDSADFGILPGVKIQ